MLEFNFRIRIFASVTQNRMKMTTEPQFPYADIYITPFSSRRRYDEDGRVSYVPIERNLHPTGVEMIDDFVNRLTDGQSSTAAYCRKYGITRTQLSNLFLLLTGAHLEDFRRYYCLRLADDLLRYTNMEVREIARRSGLGTSTNLFYIFSRHLKCSATDRRYALRKKGDVGRYKL